MDAWILKLNGDGAIEWQKVYGGEHFDAVYSIQQTSDGGYVAAGHTVSFAENPGYPDIWVLKLNDDGTVEWQKAYGEDYYRDRSFSIRQANDEGYVVVGDYAYGIDRWDAWILKLNSDGTVTWQKKYGGEELDSARSILQTSDSGFIVGGFSGSFGEDIANFWVLELNGDGAVSWEKAYGGASSDSSSSILEAVDGGYIVAGNTYSFGAGDMDFWILKIHANGFIDFDTESGATMSSTSSHVIDTDIISVDTDAAVTSTDAVPQDTHAVVTGTDATVQEQTR